LLQRFDLRVGIAAYGDEGGSEVWSWYGLSISSICDSADGGNVSTACTGGGNGHGATVLCTEAQALNRGNTSNGSSDDCFIFHLSKLSGDTRDRLDRRVALDLCRDSLLIRGHDLRCADAALVVHKQAKGYK
jgi:hypothetical protein